MAECHVVFLPLMISGHLIPMVDMAIVMASRGVKTTIITTQASADRFSKAIEQTINYHHQITLHTFEPKPDQSHFDIVSGYQESVEQIFQESQPNCIIADKVYAWTTKVAAKFNMPRIVFDPIGFFSRSVAEVIRLYEPEKTVSSDSEPFLVPQIPDEIKFTKKQLPKLKSEMLKMYMKMQSDALEADLASYGNIVNTFYELEPEYARFYRQVLKRKAWHVGPVSLCCKNVEDKFERDKKSTDEHECLKWLDSKAPNSVIYINFGAMVTVAASQIYEIAMGLEASNHNFIWVIKNDQETSIPEGFQEKMKASGKGLIIKGWVPQVPILEHVSVGAFMTQNGGNSTLEAVCAGVAMVTWPVIAEQFYNSKLVTDVLKTGALIGDVEWSETSTIEGVKRDAIQKVLERIMSPEEGGKMRRRAQILKENAKAAVEEGGSSYSDLTSFIEEMKAIKSKKNDK